MMKENETAPNSVADSQVVGTFFPSNSFWSFCVESCSHNYPYSCQMYVRFHILQQSPDDVIAQSQEDVVYFKYRSITGERTKIPRKKRRNKILAALDEDIVMMNFPILLRTAWISSCSFAQTRLHGWSEISSQIRRPSYRETLSSKSTGKSAPLSERASWIPPVSARHYAQYSTEWRRAGWGAGQWFQRIFLADSK